MVCGQIFDGKYKIQRAIGQGGMSRVYLAENINLGTFWAIKEISKKYGKKADLFIEPNILKRLEHPSLPRIFDIIETDENLYIIEDYIDGVSLDKKLEEEKKFSENMVLGWAAQICDVLSYLHNQKPYPIIYRDMKPSNIILTKNGSVKLIDFGIAREFKEDAGSDTVYLGTMGYAAPEQYGSGQTGVTTDIYSLGITLYHLVTGKGPNDSPYELKPVRYFDENLSDGIERIISKCTMQNPAKRYGSAEELLDDIEAVLAKDKAGQNETGCDDIDRTMLYGHARGFRKLVLTIWDNAEFGCEIAYSIAKMTDFTVMLIDLDLLNPKADICLGIKKTPERIRINGVLNSSGLNVAMDSIEKNCLDARIMAEASVKRKELKNLYVLTGSYKLDNYEYYDNESLSKLIETSYRHFDITLLLVNKSIYDSFTVISLHMSDFNIIPLRADIDALREFNSYIVFLREKQGIAVEKSKFVAFEYIPQLNLSKKLLISITEDNYWGHVGYSRRRAKYRNLKVPYSRHMEKDVADNYRSILVRLGILPKTTVMEMLKRKAENSFKRIEKSLKKLIYLQFMFGKVVIKKGEKNNAGN